MRVRDDLRDYQDRLADRLERDLGKRPGALLAVEMSMGKTATTATAVRALLDTFMVRKVLIVAPLRVAQKTWPDEFAEWQHLAPLRWKSLCGTKVGQKVTAQQRETWLREFLADPMMEIALINRENVVWLYRTLRKMKKRWPFDLLVYDESSRLKEGKKVTGTRRMSEFGVYAKVRKEMDFVIELTGTPTPKGLIDLWGQLYVIDQGKRLGTTKQAFLDRWFTSKQVGATAAAREYSPKPEAEKQIMRRVKDVMVSLKLPPELRIPTIPTYHWADLTDAQMKQYRKFQKELALQLEDREVLAENAGVLAGKLMQFANGSVYHQDTDDPDSVREAVAIHSHKLDVLDSIIQETNGANLLVAYSYKFDRAAIKKRFRFAVDGDEPGALDAWNRGEVRMLLTHPASLGHGMNLQFGGHNIVWYGLNASLELYQQFNARLPRPGQGADTVFIRHILTRGTFEEGLVDVLEDRDATQERITDAVKFHLGA